MVAKDSGFITADFPNLSGIMDEFRKILTDSEFKTAVRKSLMAGGRIMLESAKANVPTSARRLKPGQRLARVSTGLLKRALSIIARSGTNGSYVVIGSDRDTTKQILRGRKTITAIPGKYVHLVEKGFVAVARQKGVKGRQDDWILKLIRNGQLLKIQADQSAKPIFDLTDYDANRSLVARFTDRVAKAQSRIAGAKRTPVAGRNFLKAAVDQTKDQAVQKTIETLGTVVPDIIEKRLARWEKKGRYTGPQRGAQYKS